jgi:hypothetical protein
LCDPDYLAAVNMTAEGKRSHPVNCHQRPVEPDVYDDLGLPPAQSEGAALVPAQTLAKPSWSPGPPPMPGFRIPVVTYSIGLAGDAIGRPHIVSILS